MLGGHSVEDEELKYGLSVTGFIHPNRILTKHGLHVGDRLVLTKPWVQVSSTRPLRATWLRERSPARSTAIMAALNRTAATVMRGYPVHACTDITGFGLIGHLAEMMQGTGLWLKNRPGKAAHYRCCPGLCVHGHGTGRRPQKPEFSGLHGGHGREGIDPAMQDILYDPQTSGGLCIAVEPTSADALVDHLQNEGVEHAAVIGEVVDYPAGIIQLA